MRSGSATVIADGDSDDHLPRGRKKLVSSRRAKFMTSVKDLNADNISVKAVAMDMTDLGLSNGALSSTGQDDEAELKLLSPFRCGVLPGNGLVLDPAMRPTSRSANRCEGNKERVLSELTSIPTKAMTTTTRPDRTTGLQTSHLTIQHALRA